MAGPPPEPPAPDPSPGKGDERGEARGGGVLGYFVRHRTAANLLLAVMILGGLAALNNLRTQLWPDIVVNTVEVIVTWRGAGPEHVDRGVIQVLQPALEEVDGVAETTAIARTNRAIIRMEFEAGEDINAAAAQVEAAVSGVTALPEDAEPPIVRRRAWSDKVTDIVLHGPVDAERIGRLAQEMTDRLRAAGLSRVEVRGAPPRVIRVSVPERARMRRDLSLEEVAATVRAAAAADPGGWRAGARVSTGAERRTPEALGDAVLRTLPDGEKLRLRDVATIEDEGDRFGMRYYVEGEAAALVRVRRGANGDTLAMLDTVRRVTAEMAPTLPEGVESELVFTTASMIEARLALLLDNAALGLALVVGVLFLFLSARTALWVAMGIPAALLAAVGGMWLAGMSLNMVSLFALILTLGIVVDDAIVVGEHADALSRDGRLSPLQAAERAARRMSGPVFASALTTLIAFAGLSAIEGRFGLMIADIPMAVGLVLLASLAECFLILPNHMRHALSGGGRRRAWDAPSRLVNRGFEGFRDRAFRPLMARAIRLRGPVLGLAVLLLALALESLVDGRVPWRFWNPPETSTISGNIAMLAGAEREDTLAQMAMMERAVRAAADRMAAEHGRDPVRFMLSQVGGPTGRGLAVQDVKEPYQLAAVTVELIPADQRPYSAGAFLSAAEAELERHALAEFAGFRGGRGGPGGDSLSVRLGGADPVTLKSAAETLKAELSVHPQVGPLEDSLSYDRPELRVELTPLGRALGMTTESLGREIRARLTAIEAAEFAAEGRPVRVLVGPPRAQIRSDFLHNARIRTPDGGWTPLSELAEVSSRPGFSSLRRQDGRLTVTVRGDLDQSDAAAATEIETRLREEILPALAARHDLDWRLTGLAEQERGFLSDATLAAGACLVGIYLTLAWVFASWSRPFAVLLAAPFGLIGAVWGHAWMGEPLSMFSVVGLIGMTGIIINDSIVLVSAIDAEARRRPYPAAALEAVCGRLRPVLLTTLTTVLGLAPMLFESSTQAQFLKPTVITLCFGLAFGFVLVLLVTPAIAVLQRDAAGALRSARRMARRLTA